MYRLFFYIPPSFVPCPKYPFRRNCVVFSVSENNFPALPSSSSHQKYNSQGHPNTHSYLTFIMRCRSEPVNSYEGLLQKEPLSCIPRVPNTSQVRVLQPITGCFCISQIFAKYSMMLILILSQATQSFIDKTSFYPHSTQHCHLDAGLFAGSNATAFHPDECVFGRIPIHLITFMTTPLIVSHGSSLGIVMPVST